MMIARSLPLSSSRSAGLLATLVTISVLVLLAACAQRPSLFVDVAPVEPAPNIAVMQSDVLVINGEAVRLADAVTPQPSPDARCAAEALASRQAALRLKALANGVKTISVVPTGARDSNNRPYAHILLDGEDPAHDLVVEGLAVTSAGKPFDWCGPISASFPRAAHISDLSFFGS